MGNLFDTILVHPIINILVAIYQGLVFFHIPHALGFAIILLTVVIRFLLYPLTTQQLKASKKMQEMAPHLSKLKEKHKNDSKRLQQETMSLYQQHGVNPAAGCLPMLIQLPIIWALYSVLQKIVSLKPAETMKVINDVVYIDSLKLNHMWETVFFGIPLGKTPSQLLSVVGYGILLVPILTGVFQFIQSKMMFSTPKEKTTTEKKSTADDFSSAMQAQSLYILPAMIGYFSFQFPFGLSLYWNTFTIFGIIQQYFVQGLGGLEAWMPKKNEAVIITPPPAKPKKKKKK